MDWTSTAAAAIINSQREALKREREREFYPSTACALFLLFSRGMYVRGVCVFAATLNLYNAS
jgi:hypothetical protein